MTVSCPSECFQDEGNLGEGNVDKFWGEGNFGSEKKVSSSRKTKSLTSPPPHLAFSTTLGVSGDLSKVKEAILLTDGQHVISKDIRIGALKDA